LIGGVGDTLPRCIIYSGGESGLGLVSRVISNHRKLLWSKATVVNVAEKPEQDSGRYD
jgi:hypothetical protein